MSGVVVVTGSASGLGRTYCRALSAAGWTVVGADLRETEDVALSVVTDVSDRRQTERLAEEALERFGRIDALVNNAAYYTPIVKRPFEEIDDEEWRRCSTSTSAAPGSALEPSRRRCADRGTGRSSTSRR